MKILSLFLYILIVVVLSFYSCKNERKKVVKYGAISIQLEKYQNKEYGFSIEYPVEWQNLRSNQNVIFAVKMIKDSLDKSFQNTIHITSLLDSNDTQVVLNDIVKASINDMSNSFEDFQLLTNEVLDINNLPVIKIKCTFLSNNDSITTILYFVKTSNNVYLIGLSGLSNEFTKYEKIYEYIAKSFNVLE